MRVDVYNRTGTYLDVVGDALAPQFQEQLNAAGSGRLSLPVDSATLARTPGLLGDGNRVVATLPSGYQFGWRVESKQRKLVGEGQVWQVGGRGLLSVLADAVVYPDWGLRPAAGDDRYFTWVAKDGPWRVVAEWAEPLFHVWGPTDFGVRANHPALWPDRAGSWMWPSPGPEVSTPAGTAYFRLPVTFASARRVRCFATADNEFDLYVSGVPVLTGTSWKTTYSADVDMPAGAGLVAIEGRNEPPTVAGMNPAGVLFAMFTINDDGTTGDLLYRSGPGVGWLARMDGGSPPGWNAGQVLAALVTEAQARGVDALTGVTWDWTDTVDSDGNPWPTLVDRSFRHGADYLDVLSQLVELGVDVRITPGMVLQARGTQGVHRDSGSNPMTLRPAKNLTDGDYEADASSTRTLLLVQTDTGWFERAGGDVGQGRREAFLQVGNATSPRQVDLVVAYTFAQQGAAAERLTVALADTAPLADYFVGDWVLAPNDVGTLTSYRVRSVTASVDDAGTLTLVPELASKQTEYAERLSRSVKSMIPGTLGGQIASASPVKGRFGTGAVEQVDAGGSLGAWDTFPALGTTYQLSQLPRPFTEHVTVNGNPQLEGVDYTIDRATGRITFTSPLDSSDRLWVRYLPNGVAPVLKTLTFAGWTQHLAGNGWALSGGVATISKRISGVWTDANHPPGLYDQGIADAYRVDYTYSAEPAPGNFGPDYHAETFAGWNTDSGIHFDTDHSSSALYLHRLSTVVLSDSGHPSPAAGDAVELRVDFVTHLAQVFINSTLFAHIDFSGETWYTPDGSGL